MEMEISMVKQVIQEELFLEFQIIDFETYFKAANFQNVTSITKTFEPITLEFSEQLISDTHTHTLEAYLRHCQTSTIEVFAKIKKKSF